nr:MAG TPA: hypothetical protein [Caudoviricetes sp.]
MGSVSIHAPTRGATQSFSGQASEDLFQSTHPHGVRHKPCYRTLPAFDGFNPRTHTGCDKPYFGNINRVD